MTIIIVAIIAVIAIGIGLYFSAFKTTYKITSIKNYTAPDGSFSFQYPEFEGWDVVSITNVTKANTTTEVSYDESAIILNTPNKNSPNTKSQIIISKYPYSKQDFEIPSMAISNPNPNAVPYTYNKPVSDTDIVPNHNGYAIFYGKNHKVYVNLDNLSEKNGFASDKFFEKVIETFKFSVTTGGTDQVNSETIKKIFLESGDDTYGVWKDKNGTVVYIATPAAPGSDEFVYLFDVSGNLIVKSGGFASIKANDEKYRNLTKDLLFESRVKMPN
ncbi:MAG TPA: hypothetical protein VK675_02225 [Candidatus Paceibacterota bacterium]|nr:hypothetical protein [Candidatus Paceibacterota bacterium]